MTSVKNLRKAYKKLCKPGPEIAVENVCFELTPGNIIGLLVTSVAGKTTALKMIANVRSEDKMEENEFINSVKNKTFGKYEKFYTNVERMYKGN